MHVLGLYAPEAGEYVPARHLRQLFGDIDPVSLL